MLSAGALTTKSNTLTTVNWEN